jgi:hypothetical protein
LEIEVTISNEEYTTVQETRKCLVFRYVATTALTL